jgi:hypothetical protein
VAKISQYPVITSLTGSELVLMDSGNPTNRQTVTATTSTIVQSMSVFTGSQNGLVPASGSFGTAGALRADGVWSATFTGTFTFSTITVSTLNCQTGRFSLSIGVNGASPPSQFTGWGTPTGAAAVSNFAGASATLVQTSTAVAQIITALKAYGFFGI